MLRVIGEGLGKKVHFISCPYPIAYAGACAVYGVTLKKVDYREKVQRLCEPRVSSHSEASDAFDYAPRAFAEGVVDEIREYQSLKKR